jgi:hypothetical protein
MMVKAKDRFTRVMNAVLPTPSHHTMSIPYSSGAICAADSGNTTIDFIETCKSNQVPCRIDISCLSSDDAPDVAVKKRSWWLVRRGDG